MIKFSPITISDVGPITHAFTSGEDQVLDEVIDKLIEFEEAVRGLTAVGGGDYPEYAFSAMLEALKYSFIDEYNETFTPMHYNSEMIVITDAESKLGYLSSTVIQTANTQGVHINFILNTSSVSGSYYANVAEETGGIIYGENVTSWSILNFYNKYSAASSVTGRKRRYLPPSYYIYVSVSRFVYRLSVSILVEPPSGTVQVTLPNGEVENADIEENVMIYLKSNPLPGRYFFNAGVSVQDVLIEQDTTIDVGLLYLDNNFTVSSPKPLVQCKL